MTVRPSTVLAGPTPTPTVLAGPTPTPTVLAGPTPTPTVLAALGAAEVHERRQSPGVGGERR